MAVFLPVLLFLSNLLNYLDRQLFTALFPVLAPAYHLSDTKMGLLGSSFTLSYLVAAPVAGVLLDRFSPRLLLSAGVLVFSLGMAIASTASGTVGLFSGRILTGVGEASLIVVGPRILGGRKGGGVRLGLFFLALPIGVATGFLLASRALSDFHRILFLPVLPGILLGGMFLLPFVKGEQGPEMVEDCSVPSLPVLSRFSLLFCDVRLRTLAQVSISLKIIKSWLCLMCFDCRFYVLEAEDVPGSSFFSGRKRETTRRRSPLMPSLSRRLRCSGSGVEVIRMR